MYFLPLFNTHNWFADLQQGYSYDQELTSITSYRYLLNESMTDISSPVKLYLNAEAGK